MNNKRRFLFNKIYIIESLSIYDKKTGEELYNDLLRYISIKIPILQETVIERINSKAEFQYFFKKLVLDVSTGIYPFLHFEIHGSIEGFVLNSGERISWKDAADLLRQVNIKTRNNLMISLATCYGAYIYSSIFPSQRSPFYGFIGPLDKVTEGEILMSYTKFFDFIMQTSSEEEIDLNAAVEILNQSNGTPKFILQVSEVVFNQVIREHKTLMKNPGNFNRRVGDIFKRAIKNKIIKGRFTRKEVKQFIEKQMLTDKSIEQNLKSHFLMLDMREQ